VFEWLKKLFRPANVEYARDTHEHGPVVPVAPPTSGPSTPAMEVDTESVDPNRE
jgi:hypothetical protein